MRTDASDGRPRTVRLVPGGEYVVTPTNPAKLRNRGRRCEYRGVTTTPDGKHRVARVYYLDTRRAGRAELDELVPAP